MPESVRATGAGGEDGRAGRGDEGYRAPVTGHDSASDEAPTQRERMLAGELYLADDPRLHEESLRAMALIEAYNTSPSTHSDERRRILTELLGSFGEGSQIRPPFYCDYGYQIHIGRRTFANFGLVASDVAEIRIGDDVQIGPGVQLLTPTHPLEPGPRRGKWEAASPITIGDNVWLGGGVIVCPGVSIHSDTVVGAGSVVTRDIPSGVLAAGLPARVVRSLVDGEQTPPGR